MTSRTVTHRRIWTLTVCVVAIATATLACWLTWGLFDWFAIKSGPVPLYRVYLTLGSALLVGVLGGFISEMAFGNSLTWLEKTSRLLWITAVSVGGFTTMLVIVFWQSSAAFSKEPIYTYLVMVVFALIAWALLRWRIRWRRHLALDPAERGFFLRADPLTRVLLASFAAAAIGVLISSIGITILYDTDTYLFLTTAFGWSPFWKMWSEVTPLLIGTSGKGLLKYAVVALSWPVVTGFMVEVTLQPFRRFL